MKHRGMSDKARRLFLGPGADDDEDETEGNPVPQDDNLDEPDDTTPRPTAARCTWPEGDGCTEAPARVMPSTPAAERGWCARHRIVARQRRVRANGAKKAPKKQVRKPTASPSKKVALPPKGRVRAVPADLSGLVELAAYLRPDLGARLLDALEENAWARGLKAMVVAALPERGST